MSLFIYYYCAFCGKNESGLSYFKFDPNYHTSSCCSSLICDVCVNSRCKQKCMACSTTAAHICVSSKNGYRYSSGWMDLYEKHKNFHVSIFHGTFRYLIPFTGTRVLGEWDQVAKILGNKNPDFSRFRDKYNQFVHDFFSAQLLFYSLRSEPMRRLIGLRPKTPNMLRFFSIVDDMAKFSQFSRKKVLHRNQNGFIFMLLRRLQIDGKFAVILQKNILAKKSQLPN
jgi:hypothetical protein